MASLSDIISALTHVRRGDPIEKVASSTRINAIIDALLYLLSGANIKLGRGGRKGQTLGTVTIDFDIRGGVRGGGGSNRVWNHSTESDGDSHVVVFIDGMVNNIVASNIGEDIQLRSGKNYIFAIASASGGDIQQVRIIVDQNLRKGRLLEAEGAPPAEVPVMIAMAVVSTVEGESTVEVTRLRYTNVVCTPVETRRKSRVPPGPGEEAFIRLYAWRVEDSNG